MCIKKFDCFITLRLHFLFRREPCSLHLCSASILILLCMEPLHFQSADLLTGAKDDWFYNAIYKSQIPFWQSSFPISTASTCSCHLDGHFQGMPWRFREKDPLSLLVLIFKSNLFESIFFSMCCRINELHPYIKNRRLFTSSWSRN